MGGIKMTRERYLEKMARKIASYVYAVAVLESGDANWCIYFDEIEKRFGLKDEEHQDEWLMLEKPLCEDEELVEAILEELYKYDGLDGNADCVWVDDCCFDLNLWHDYRATYTDLDEEEDCEEEVLKKRLKIGTKVKFTDKYGIEHIGTIEEFELAITSCGNVELVHIRTYDEFIGRAILMSVGINQIEKIVEGE